MFIILVPCFVMSVGRGRREGGAVILVSLFCDFGGAWREEGRAGRGTRPNFAHFRGIVGIFFFIILVSYFCNVGRVFCYSGVIQAKPKFAHLARHCHLLVILVSFLSFWWGAEGGRAGQGTKLKFAYFPRHCHYIVISLSFGCQFRVARRNGGRMTETTKMTSEKRNT